MWTRRELKTRGKAAMHRNYWKTVLVSLLVLILLGGTSGASGAGSAASSSAASVGSTENVQESFENIPGLAGSDVNSDSEIPPLPEEYQEFVHETTTIPPVVIFIILIFVLIFVAIAIVANIFLFNPLHAGAARFFLRNLNTQAEVKELAYGYDHGYMNIVKTIFLKGLYTFFWSLLFIIPGIIKSYSYRMMPYILAEHPDMPTKEVFARSREMMNGNKWKAFVLDLSFIGWNILSLLTLGLLGIFFVSPYQNMTNAALYETLAYGGAPYQGYGYDSAPMTGPYDAGTAPAENDIPAYNVGELPYNKEG